MGFLNSVLSELRDSRIPKCLNSGSPEFKYSGILEFCDYGILGFLYCIGPVQFGYQTPRITRRTGPKIFWGAMPQTSNFRSYRRFRSFPPALAAPLKFPTYIRMFNILPPYLYDSPFRKKQNVDIVCQIFRARGRNAVIRTSPPPSPVFYFEDGNWRRS